MAHTGLNTNKTDEGMGWWREAEKVREIMMATSVTWTSAETWEAQTGMSRTIAPQWKQSVMKSVFIRSHPDVNCTKYVKWQLNITKLKRNPFYWVRSAKDLISSCFFVSYRTHFLKRCKSNWLCGSAEPSSSSWLCYRPVRPQSRFSLFFEFGWSS